jgi:hypothetical protein
MFIVLVSHSTGHGLATEPVLITADVAAVVLTARMATGPLVRYSFYERDCCAVVVEMPLERSHFKGSLQGSSEAGYRLIIRPQFNGSFREGPTSWSEEWIHDGFKKEYERASAGNGA